MDIENFEELYIMQLQQLSDGEQQLVKSLPQMAKAAHSEDLRAAFEEHLTQTREHARRLEKLLAEMGEDSGAQENDGMQALIDEADDIISGFESSALRDVALIGAGNKVEHLEIAAYGTVKALAQMLGRVDAVTLLDQTLREEKAADQKLTALAEAVVNPAGFGAGSSG